MAMKTGFKIKIYTIFVSYMVNSIVCAGHYMAGMYYHKHDMSDIYSHTSLHVTGS